MIKTIEELIKKAAEEMAEAEQSAKRPSFAPQATINFLEAIYHQNIALYRQN